MSMKCSICLFSFKQPVCLPCGHLYCTRCLSDHVNIPDSDDSSASCPTCRATFNTVTPDLTCLPKRYHQFIHPSVRRVYIDNSAAKALEQNLQAANARIKSLEKKNAQLVEQRNCGAASLELLAVQEEDARNHIEELNRIIGEIAMQYAGTDANLSELRCQYEDLQTKYSKMKKRMFLMQEQLELYEGLAESDAPRSAGYIVKLPRSSQSESNMSFNRSTQSSTTSPSSVQPGAKRKIRPLPKRDPNSAQATRHASPLLTPEDRIKRTRLAEDYSRVQRSNARS